MPGYPHRELSGATGRPWRRIRADGNPAGYATTVMFRTYISWWRRRRRTPIPVDLPERPATGDPFAPVEARLTLREALGRLPRLQQAVLVATYLRDHDDGQIAAMIGRSPATVRSLRHRGLKALQIGLGEEDGHARPGDPVARRVRPA